MLESVSHHILDSISQPKTPISVITRDMNSLSNNLIAYYNKQVLFLVEEYLFLYFRFFVSCSLKNFASIHRNQTIEGDAIAPF